MGMQLGGASGGVKNDINVTPLIDVVLVLLIIFLVTMPIMMRTITLEVPRKIDELRETPPVSKQITVLVRRDLTIVLNTGDREIEIPMVELTKTLVPLLQDRKTDKLIFVDFEDAVPWGEVVATMDSIRRVAADQLRNQDPNSGADPIDIKVALKMKDEEKPPAP
jgi:biopolymer transport protein ExbD